MSAPAPIASEKPGAEPLRAAEFAQLLQTLAPFERRPHLAVAVSGGPDSLALCLLAAGWARAHGGEVTGLTIDHGLRPESAAEAASVQQWLAARGIRDVALRWTGAKPRTGIQAAARRARYGLLTRWCRETGVLHLLLGHHADDQAETVALRLARRSGASGLAGMAAVREVPGLRVLRPLLGVPKARLCATLAVQGQPWLEDPSNRTPAFARARLRMDGQEHHPERLETARAHGQRRRDLDGRLADWLARHARLDPLGFVKLDPACVATAPAEVLRAGLVRCLQTVGGRAYPPRTASLDRLCHDLLDDPAAVARTLGGCRIIGGLAGIVICRERGCIELRPRTLDRRRLLFDDRFMIEFEHMPADLEVAPLGERGWMTRRELAEVANGPVVPRFVGETLPALWRADRLVAVPQLGLATADEARLMIKVRLRPRHPLAGPAFTGSSPLFRPRGCLC